AGLAEDDLGLMLRELGRLAGVAERYADYAAPREEVAPEILDGALVVLALPEVAQGARQRLGQPERARRLYGKVREQEPERRRAPRRLRGAARGDRPRDPGWRAGRLRAHRGGRGRAPAARPAGARPPPVRKGARAGAGEPRRARRARGADGRRSPRAARDPA